LAGSAMPLLDTGIGGSFWAPSCLARARGAGAGCEAGTVPQSFSALPGKTP